MITPRENMLRYFRNEPCLWTPSTLDQLSFRPSLIPGHVARGMVAEQEPYTGKFGGKDMFGVDWVFDAQAGGSMEKAPLIDDIDDWEEKVKFPDPDEIEWERCARENERYLNTDKLIQTTIYSSFFERLITFVGFEKAAMAMIDEEQKEEVKKLFDKLADLYIDMIIRMHRFFNVDLVEIHDDWGTQLSTIFSVETHKELLVPYIARIAEKAHSEGVLIEMHSCGKIDALVPNIISTGVDTWRGQAIVDKRTAVEKHGDIFKFCAEIRPKEPVGDDEVIALLDEAITEWQGKNIWFGIGNPFTPEQKEKMYRHLREKTRTEGSL